jgi:hypothetical protein
MAECSTNYTCTPVWYTETDLTVIAQAAGPHAVDLNVTCIVKAGNIQFQVQDELGEWFTPTEAAYTVNASNLVRFPRANMPSMRILATADATFSVQGVLR